MPKKESRLLCPLRPGVEREPDPAANRSRFAEDGRGFVNGSRPGIRRTVIGRGVGMKNAEARRPAKFAAASAFSLSYRSFAILNEPCWTKGVQECETLGQNLLINRLESRGRL